MKTSSNKLKRQTKLTSSNISIQSISARSMFRVGQPAIYIQPKIISDNQCLSQLSLTPNHVHQHDKSVGQYISEQRLIEWNQKNKQSLFFGTCAPLVISYKKYSSWPLTIIQCLIFCTYVLGTLGNIKQFKYVDFIGNIICILKIILVHTWIIFYNSTKQQQLHTNTNTNPKQPNAPPPPSHTQQSLTLYINKLQLYELLQIYSIITTILLIIFNNYPILQIVLHTLRLIRLFYPFACNRRAQNKWRACTFVHVLKIAIIISMVIACMAVGLQLLLNNIDNYYCMDVEQLGMLTQSVFPAALPAQCGITNPCTNAMQCHNIYSLADTQPAYHQIQAYLNYQYPSFSANYVISLLTVFTSGGPIYQTYHPYINQWIIFPISVLVWLLLYVLMGVEIGQAIRCESLQNWQRIMSRKQQTHPTIVNKNKQKKRRHSNIAYITSQARIAPPPISDPNPTNPCQHQQVSSQFSSQIKSISKQLAGRSMKQKVATLVFNLLCVAQVCLIICDNLNIQQIINRNIGIALGVIFILWSFGLAFAIYQHISQGESLDMDVDSSQTYVLVYQVLAYSLTLLDYIMRAVNGKLIFEQPSIVTPFSHAAISLRVVFVLYNNGFDAHISYYTQKIIENSIKKAQLMGFMLVLSVVAAMVECIVLQKLQISHQIDTITDRIRIVYGIGGGQANHDYISNTITIIIKFISMVTVIYIAKHINLGYDIIFQIDFSQASMELPQPNSTYQQSNTPTQSNKIKQFLTDLHNLHYYSKLKLTIIAAYSLISIIFQNNDNTIALILFILDIYLCIDIITQIIAYGFARYLSIDAPVKVLYMLSQIFLSIAFFAHVPSCVVSSIHITRVFLLFAYVPPLYAVYVLIKTILLHPKLKIYKIVVLTLPLILMGMCLTTFYVDQPNTTNTSSTSGTQKFMNALAYSMSLVYGLNWSFTDNHNQSNLISSLCLNIIFVCVILYVHIILTFMMVTYFVNRNCISNGQLYDQILRQYVPTQPAYYFHYPAKHYAIYDYLKIVKVGIIFVSFVLIAILSGNILQYSEIRQILAIVNLILCFIEIFIYVIENLLIKKDFIAWNFGQIILLALSLPGTFSLIVPVTKFSVGSQLNLIVRMCLLFSMLRLLRILPLLANRRVFFLSSKILRRISKQLYLWQACAIFIFILASILPFSMFFSNYAEKNFEVEFLNFLTGSLFHNKDISIIQLIVKFACTFLVLFPLRIMLIARVISSFLNNKPNELSALKDQISQAISNNGLLDKQQEILFLPSSQIYRFTAQIYRIFEQFGKRKKIKCISYDQVVTKLAKLNIPVYLKEQQQGNNSYGIFAFDIIWYLFQLYKVKTMTQDQYFDSLYQKIRPKIQRIGRSHFGTTQLSAYLKLKEKIKSKIKLIRQKKLDHPHQ